MPRKSNPKQYPPLPAEGFASIDAVCGAFGGRGRSTIYHWVKHGQFAAPVATSAGRIGWPVDYIRSEIERRKAGAFHITPRFASKQ